MNFTFHSKKYKPTNNEATMISDLFAEQLEKKNYTLEEFSELLIRLLDYGVLCRDESQVEEHLYDRFIQLKNLI
jgi:hypothetical protein